MIEDLRRLPLRRHCLSQVMTIFSALETISSLLHHGGKHKILDRRYVGNFAVSDIDPIIPLKDCGVCFKQWREQNWSAPKSPYSKHVSDLCL